MPCSPVYAMTGQRRMTPIWQVAVDGLCRGALLCLARSGLLDTLILQEVYTARRVRG